jgi:sugar phosphate permease
VTIRAPSRYRIRWVMVAYLFGFAFFLYSYRTSFNVAAVQMMPELQISQMQLGWLMTAYLFTYTVLQLPGGVFGQWLGARRGLAIAGIVCLAAQLITPLAPLWLTGTALTIALLFSRLLLGAAQAPIFPISTGVIESWFPVGRWGCPNGLQTAGLHLGSAAATPIIAFLMQAYGWKQALIWTSLPLLLLIVSWAWYGRNRAASHPSVSGTELAELGVAAERAEAVDINRRDLLRVLRNRDVLLLATSYTIMNYVFYLIGNWSFIYLVQERHLSVPDSGVLGSLPFIAAAIGSGAGGRVADGLALRFGARRGYRILPLTMLPLAGLFLFVGVKVSSPLWAVTALSLAYGTIETTEGIYSAATTAVAREHSMAAWGVVGTGGNLGGIIGTPIVAWLSAHGAWTAAYVTGTTAAVISGILWLWIDGSRTLVGVSKIGCR